MRKSALVGWLLLAPALLLLGGLVVFPVLYNVWLSLFDKHAFMPVQSFVGLRHYRYFASDPEFWSSFYYGSVYAGVTMVLQLGVGVPAALLLNEAFRGRNLLRGIVLFPYMIPTIVAVILWKWLLNDSYGLVNHLLVQVGLVRAPVPWLGPDYIMAALIITSVWQFFPFVVVTYLARLSTIAPELYEAATVDGASAWRRFLHVTLPQTASVLFVIVLLRSIWMFTKFDTVWLLAGDGGVSRYIRTLPVYAYARSFTYLQAGMGAALAVIMFAMLLAATAVYFRVFRTEEVFS
ncbi:MAG TPA: sugar ABC transporter permease [Candidatus Dormibacteraeota bacterium]|nr:sugar ABC transporter permease [Candidatus Dormibacteraeota bacterium]